jgi:outer membrane protein assembly factor BamB
MRLLEERIKECLARRGWLPSGERSPLEPGSISKSWVNGTPAVRDGVVYVGTSDSSQFMALDAKTGRLQWNFDARAYVFSSAALAGDLAYVGSHNGRLYAIQ